MSINDAITKAIQENLPAATAGELQKYILKADATEKDFKALKLKFDEVLNTTETQAKQIKDYKGKKEFFLSLQKREANIILAENNLKVAMAELKIIEAEKRADAVYKLAEIAFKNRSITKMVSTSVPVYQSYPGGGGSYSAQSGSECHTIREVDSDL